MSTGQILLVRHGQTAFNTRGVYQGQMDSPLTPEGVDQARCLAPRVVATIDRITSRHAGELVVAVTHGGALGAFAKHVLGLPVESRRRFDMGNTSISLFYRDGAGEWMARFLGDLAHLPNLPEPNQTEG